jgi:hypothetical protein
MRILGDQMHTLHLLLNSARARAGVFSVVSLLAMVLAGAAGQKWT